MLSAESKAPADHRLKQDVHTPARNDRAPRFREAFANCRPCHAWPALPVAAEPPTENANFRIMNPTDPII